MNNTQCLEDLELIVRIADITNSNPSARFVYLFNDWKDKYSSNVVDEEISKILISIYEEIKNENEHQLLLVKSKGLISEQTKRNLVDFYTIAEYLGCEYAQEYNSQRKNFVDLLKPYEGIIKSIKLI